MFSFKTIMKSSSGHHQSKSKSLMKICKKKAIASVEENQKFQIKTNLPKEKKNGKQIFKFLRKNKLED